MKERGRPGPVRILVVEDNEDDALFLAMAFERCHANCTLTVARDGTKALTSLRGEGGGQRMEPPAQVILLDLNLPGLSGYEVLREIRRDPDLKAIPVIVLSTSDSPHDVAQAYEGGANCYVTKPAGLKEYRILATRLSKFWFHCVRLPT